ncbi:MAG: type 2 isopentenyl-diphosphate Delta-isomerase [Anaerolineaceae bacterium]|nr:type 2 isopentenyl-diphosphate Delta-isomerase [Anaerolineaceae bacterium]
MTEKQVTEISKRKDEHLRICLEEDVSSTVSNGFDELHLKLQSLPEIDFKSINLSTEVFGKQLDAPLLISSMTGGSGKTKHFNQIFAQAANQFNIAMGVGSQRAALLHEGLSETYSIVRKEAPNALLIANLGVSDLNYGFGLAECQRAVDMLEADALFLHINALQECLQPEGNTDFSNLLSKIEQICSKISVPVIAKEVGCGIDRQTAKALVDVGIKGIDVAGLGGTSWAAVEMYRQTDPLKRELCQSYRTWGLPTAKALEDIANLPEDIVKISSGGLRNGLDLAKSIAMGANLGGFATKFIHSANDGYESLHNTIKLILEELKLALFLTGSSKLQALKDKIER